MTVGQDLEKADHVVAPTTEVAPTRPETLTFTGVSDDRRGLLLADDHGATYTLAISPTLRAALRGDATRLGQLEIKMDSALRPRDIQARIRAGEDPELVAQAGNTTVEKIMAFVGPVLAERQHVAERAQKSNVRRPATDAGHSRTLGDSVETHLHALNLDPGLVEWDAWRREDGRWTLVATFATPARDGVAHFTFDSPGNYVVLDDQDARWLVGENVAAPAPARDDLQPVRERRLTSVPQDELPLGDDAIDLVSDGPAHDVPALDNPVDAFLDASPASDDPALREEAAEAAAAEVDPELDLDPAPSVDAAVEPDEAPSRRPVQKKKGRASVPSWDEIMFGGSDQ